MLAFDDLNGNSLLSSLGKEGLPWKGGKVGTHPKGPKPVMGGLHACPHLGVLPGHGLCNDHSSCSPELPQLLPKCGPALGSVGVI